MIKLFIKIQCSYADDVHPTTQEEATGMNEYHDLPLVLLHGATAFKTAAFKYTPILKTRFQWLDPFDESGSLDSSFYGTVRIMLCFATTPVTSEILDQYPALECIVCMPTGLDHIDLVECRRRRIRVTNAGDSFSEDVADYAVGLVIDVLRRVSAGDRFVRSGSWPSKGGYPLGFKVSGKRVGIVGLGNIGIKISKRLEAFGCIIAYNSKTIKPNVPYHFYRNALDLASNSDILIISCALTKETHHIINKEVLQALGKEGVVINIGRGSHIDEKELVEFLVRGEIKGVGLDVFEDEPNVPKDLYEMDNVVLSPHNAIAAPEAFARLEEVLIANIEAFFLNKPLVSEVDLV